MSRATKRKHVLREMNRDNFDVPKVDQQIVRVRASRGNNLHEVETSNKSVFLMSMPTKFRNLIYIKRGDFVLVQPIKEGVKVKAEMVRLLTKEHIQEFKKDKVWPEEFMDEDKQEIEKEDDNFVNRNRRIVILSCYDIDSDSDNDSDSSNDSDCDNDNDTESDDDNNSNTSDD